MAKKSKIARDRQRRQRVTRFAGRRKELEARSVSPHLAPAERERAMAALHARPAMPARPGCGTATGCPASPSPAGSGRRPARRPPRHRIASATKESPLNRRELVTAVADRTGLTRDQADSALTAVADLVTDAVARGDRVQLPGFLSVQRVARPARTGRNPRTGEALEIPAGHGVKVSAGSRLKAAVTG